MGCVRLRRHCFTPWPPWTRHDAAQFVLPSWIRSPVRSTAASEASRYAAQGASTGQPALSADGLALRRLTPRRCGGGYLSKAHPHPPGAAAIAHG